VKTSIKYAAIFSKRNKYTITFMCDFFKVSRSGYYDWVKRKDDTDKDDFVATLIEECQTKVNKTYGYRRVQIWLYREAKLKVNHKSVLRIMRKYGLLSEVRRIKRKALHQNQFQVYEAQF
jgi:transposase